MKHLCTLLIAVALILATQADVSAQSIAPGTYQYTGLASNGQPYTITATVSASGLNFQESVQADILCSSAMTVESVDPTGTIFVYKTTTPGAADCTLGQAFVFTLTPVTTTLEFRKSEGPTFLLNLQ